MNYEIDNNKLDRVVIPCHRTQSLQQVPERLDVVLIEDTHDLEIIIPLGLKLIAGIRVVAVGPEQGWQSIVANQVPAAILIDVVEHGVNILQTLRNINKAQHIPIFYTVDRGRLQDRQLPLQLGANIVIARPFDIICLAQSITKLIGLQVQCEPNFVSHCLKDVSLSSQHPQIFSIF